MPIERDHSETEVGPDDSFEALLERAAYVSGPALSSLGRRLAPGSQLYEGRLQIKRRIGEGGMGVVYEAHDEQRRAAVALKTLSRLDPSSVYRLKNEFRSLADVSHPSLCRLHELFRDGDDWFFTMELVDGERFDRWVRPQGVFDGSRVRAAFPQLCAAISAIHAAGKLHRDLKPSNVLVTQDGRVVVLDFGLAVDWDVGGIGQTLLDQSVSGTPGYMAPEQAACAPATTASDLYAVGAMLFEALTGRLPFEGSVGEMLAAKQRDRAPAVRALIPDAPHDLAGLCDALLERHPARRPDAAALLRQLGAFDPSTAEPEQSSGRAPRELLLGRQAELTQLRAAYAAMLERRPVVVFVAGESGIGKSALVAHFLDDLRAEGEAAVLAGRCYERESVPFKAFDAVLDDLSRYLRKLTRHEAGDLMPRDVFALARLFPVLERIAAVAEAPRKDIPDVHELQQRAFAALAELLGRIRDRRPLVVYVDDLQWTDRDSTVLLDYLLAQPEPTPLLLIASHRSEGAADNLLLQQTLRSARKNPRLAHHTLPIEHLTLAAAQALAERLLGAAGSDVAAAIAREAHGSPFFVGELVRQARVAGPGSTCVTLQEAVVRHVQMHGAKTRALLDVLAVAGRPLPVQLALDAAAVEHDAADRLVSERLLRVGSIEGRERTLECYHDKIRESVWAALAPERLREVHRALAVRLSKHSGSDPEHLALHFHGAGEQERAAGYYEQAGERSAAALAFDYAARQFEQALALCGPDTTRVRALRAKLGSALASAGSSRAAAFVYRDACEGAPPEQALEFMRKAAHLLMTSGYLDEGRAILGDVLTAVGLSLPRSRRRAIASALFSRARLGLRGLKLSASAKPTAVTETHLAALWSVVLGSVGNDPFVMVEMSARYARLALDSGSRLHAARALSIEAYLRSFDGRNTRPRTAGLLAEAERLATEVAQPELVAWVQEVRGCVLVHEGLFVEARPVLRDALELLTQRCTAVPFEIACGRGYDMNAANHLGQFAEISATTTAMVEDALRRGDMYQAVGIASFAMPSWLAHRGLVEAKSLLAEAKSRFRSQTAYQWIDYLLLGAELNLALHQGLPHQGFALVSEQWAALQQSQLMRMKIALAMMEYYRAACGLAAVGQRRLAAGPVLELARSAVGILSELHLPHAMGWAAVLEAALAQRTVRPERAAERLRIAVASFDSAGLRMYAASARRRLGQLIGGDEGRMITNAGEAAMATEVIRDYEATTEMLVPAIC